MEDLLHAKMNQTGVSFLIVMWNLKVDVLVENLFVMWQMVLIECLLYVCCVIVFFLSSECFAFVLAIKEDFCRTS